MLIFLECEEKKMRKKITSLITLLSCTMLIFTACSEKNCDEKFLEEFKKEYVLDYSIEQKNDDGTYTVSFIAPDVEKIVKIMAEENMEKNIKNMNEIIAKEDLWQKEYMLVVEEATNNEVEKAFYSAIAKELMMSAFKTIEYREEWSAEE